MDVVKSVMRHAESLRWGSGVLLDFGFLTSYAGLYPVGDLLALHVSVSNMFLCGSNGGVRQTVYYVENLLAETGWDDGSGLSC